MQAHQGISLWEALCSYPHSPSSVCIVIRVSTLHILIYALPFFLLKNIKYAISNLITVRKKF